MKILLTSAGLTNPSISKALIGMTGKHPEDTTLAYIPTASNIEMADKKWVIDNLINLKNHNFKAIHIVDISAVDKSIWRPQLEVADVLFFEGGNTYHLMRWLDRSGLTKLLPELLKTRVYVGVSAGSMVVCKDMALNVSQILYEEDLNETENLKGLNFVDFYILPHLNSPWFPNLQEKNIKQAAKGMKEKMYVLDDQSAVKVDGEKVEVISEGKYFEII